MLCPGCQAEVGESDAFCSACGHNLQTLAKNTEAEASLRESETRLRQILDNSPFGVSITSRNPQIRLYVNRRFIEMFGCGINDDLLAATVADSFVNSKKLEENWAVFERDGAISGTEELRKRLDGTVWWCLADWRKISFGGEEAIMVWHSDITEHKQAEEALAKKETQLRVALDHMSGGLVMVDKDFNVQVASPRFSEIYDIPAELFSVGASLKDVMAFRAERGDYGPGNPKTLLKERFQNSLDKSASWVEDTLPNGRIVELFRVPTPEDGFVAVFNDITERKRAEEALRDSEDQLKVQVLELQEREQRLEAQAADLVALAEDLEAAKQEMQHLANHDALTGLPSLRLCKDRLENALAANRRNESQTAVLFIDLDGFKAVNDSMGHEAGDEVLKGVAERLKSSVREMDTSARIGGDEFILVLPEIGHKDDAAKIAQKVIGEMSEPFPVNGGVAQIGASIGIAISPADGAAADDLLRHADESMYAIKKRGKNNFGFFS